MKLTLFIGLALLILIVAGVLASGWYFSSAILVPEPYGLKPEFEILAANGDTVTLPAPPNDRQFADTRRTGVYNLLWQDGYGRLGEILAADGERVTRRLTLIERRPPQAGDPARLEAFVYRRDPLQDHGIAFEDVRLEGEIGELRAWWIDQQANTAVLMLHGRRRADLRETLRIMPTLVDEGYSVLALAYRNHDESAMSPDGFFHYGASEWQDAVTGLEFLAEQGVERVVLYGFSMGGVVALELMQHADAIPEALAVEGVILDSPLLDMRTVIKQGAKKMALPFSDSLSNLALWMAGLRAGVDWRTLDQRQSAATIDVPVLLIAGTADSTVPIHLADSFAKRISVPLQYQRLEGVEHVEGWNQMPEAYEAWISEFLRQYAPLTASN